MFEDGIKIPKDRIAVLVGVKGKTKREIERRTSTKIKINSEEGDIIISSEDSLAVFTAKLIVHAISRGFNPLIALKLLDEENCFELVNIDDFAKKSKKRLITLRARLIGSSGKCRKLIEILTHTEIQVYGKTAGIIGLQENVFLAKHAIINLLQGSKHGNVYAYIDRQKRLKSTPK